MLQKIKKLTAQVTLVAVILVAVLFINVGSPEQLKSYILNDIEQLWGQAYSPNVGWINFYCDGASGTIPAAAPAGKGAPVMPNFCDTTPYGVIFDSTTETFSGEAYSNTYGWLDMSGLTMNPSFNVRGDTNGGAISDYIFGTTYFQRNRPNNDNPGLGYYNTSGYFCGFAYSDEIGYISFCDPQTKERNPKDVPVSGFDWDTYAVYLGIGDGDDSDSPALTTATPRVFAATDNYNETLWFQDDVVNIASVEVKIFDSNGVEQTYNAVDFYPATNRASVDITNHDFHVVGDYDLTFTACDAIGNCTDPTVENDGLYTGFFTVVAAVPDWIGNSFFEFSVPTQVADGQENHLIRTTLIDEYGNPVISVAGIKEVSVDTKFENTTRLDQIAGTGDSAVFEAGEFGFNQEGGTSTGYLTEANGGDGRFQIDMKSYAPTSKGYTPITDDGFNLFFDNMTYNVVALGGHVNVGESSGTYGVAVGFEPRKFAFSPTLVTTPEALIWDSGTSTYILDASAIENITVNAPKRFNLELQNFSSSMIASNPELGLLMDTSDNSVTWVDAITEDPIAQALILDTEDADGFDSSWNAAGGLVSGGTIDWSSIENIRMRATPELDLAAAVPEDFSTLFETYAGYDVSGKHVRHKSEMLGIGAMLFNPGIEIIGAVYSSGGTSSKQTGSELNQSLGDTAQSELESMINRSTVALTKDPTVSACTAAGDITNLVDFWNNNPDCTFFEDSVLYLENDVILNLSVDLPSGAKTILVEGGNLHIKNDFIFPAAVDNSFGVIVLKDAAGVGGNIFIYSNVTNVMGTFYAEGSVISVNAEGECGEDMTADCSGTGFCDRSFELRDQLYWKGLIATQNTIGGADKALLVFPSNVVATGCNAPDCAAAAVSGCSSREEARIYDFAYLRTFHPASGGTQIFAGSDAALVVEYDSRIQNNPPPLFESIEGSSSQFEN